MMDTIMYVMKIAKTQWKWKNWIYWVLVFIGYATDAYTSFYVYGGGITPTKFWTGFTINVIGFVCSFYGTYCLYKNWKEDDDSDD